MSTPHDTHGHGDQGHGGHAGPTNFWSKYVFSTDHKVIALQFTFAAILFVALGGLLALGVRYQLAWPQQDVPYARLLPLKMTSKAPEPNVLLWKIGGELKYLTTLQVDSPSVEIQPIEGKRLTGGVATAAATTQPRSQNLPVTVSATLKGFPKGVRVTLPKDTRIAPVASGEAYSLNVNRQAVIDRALVMADYDYAKTPQQARVVSGTVATMIGLDGKADEQVKLVGLRVYRPAAELNGNPRIDDISGPILLPIAREQTQMDITVAAHNAVANGLEVQVPAASFEISASDLNKILGSDTKEYKAGSDTQYVGAVHINGVEREVRINGKIKEVKPSNAAAGATIIVETPAQVATVDRAPIPVTPGTPVAGAEQMPPNNRAAGLVYPSTVTGMQVNFEKDVLTTDAYLTLFTMHATIMVFFVLMPVLMGGFGNFLIPLMVGARDMAFPRLNALSFWLSVPAGLLIMISFWVPGGASGGGWTMYPPLSQHAFNGGMGMSLWLFAITLVGFSTIVGTLNYLTTIVNMRAPGMTMFRMPLTIWALFITSVLALFATPVLAAAGIMLFMDRVAGTMFFAPVLGNVATGGQPLLWQHLFWFFGHPEVYILILPSMGITSDILATFSRKPVFGYKPMVYAMSAIAGLGFIVWGHHMFVSGMNPLLGTTFAVSTIFISVPSAIKTFNWLGTLWRGNIRFTPPMLFAIGFVSMFVIGGLSGIFMASTPVDRHITDTYFIVAHIHYVLFGGTMMGAFAGLYYWYPKFFGKQMDQRWGTIHFILTLIGLNGTFFLMHLLGIGGAPRRYYSHLEFDSLKHLQPLNVLMTIFAMMLGLGQLPFLYNFYVSMPRKLGRAIVATYAVLLTASAFVGFSFWNLFREFDQYWIARTLDQWFGQTSAGYSSTQTFIGYAALAALTIFVAAGCYRGMGGGVKVVAVCLAVPFLGILLGSFNQGNSVATPDAGVIAVTLRTMDPIWVAFGLGVIWSALVTAVVFAIWAIGGAIQIRRIIEPLMYVAVLPMFLLPIFLKPEVYFWLGSPTLYDYRWLLVLVATIPGAAYVAIIRPRSEFGASCTDPNPWQANSLEWATSSPPPFVNFETIPTVYRGPYEFSSPAVQEDYLPQPHELPPGVVEPAAH